MLGVMWISQWWTTRKCVTLLLTWYVVMDIRLCLCLLVTRTMASWLKSPRWMVHQFDQSACLRLRDNDNEIEWFMISRKFLWGVFGEFIVQSRLVRRKFGTDLCMLPVRSGLINLVSNIKPKSNMSKSIVIHAILPQYSNASIWYRGASSFPRPSNVFSLEAIHVIRPWEPREAWFRITGIFSSNRIHAGLGIAMI